MSTEIKGRFPRTVFVFPRVRLREQNSRNEKFTIGPITVLPDKDETWRSEFSRERPDWLKIYRDFPHSSEDAEAPLAYGSIIIAEDDEWLELHISRITGILFYLGLQANNWRVPSEALAHVGFKLTTSSSGAVEFATKTNLLIETGNAIQLLPPLELRGVGSTFSIGLETPMHQKLVHRFVTNPYDHLIVACYHLYRTQWANFLHSPREQDFAAYCACLEAALNVRKKYATNIAAELASRYDVYPELPDWILGLYAERAVFNHGMTATFDESSNDYRIRALVRFRGHSGNWIALREICRDVIHRTLEPYSTPTEKFLFSGINQADIHLRHLMSSDSAWSQMANILLQHGSVRIIRSILDVENDEWVQRANDFKTQHSWHFTRRPVDVPRLIDALRATASGMCLRAKNSGDEQSANVWLALYDAATIPVPETSREDATVDVGEADEAERIAKAAQKIRKWFNDRKTAGDDKRLFDTVNDAILAIAIHLAAFFKFWL